MKICFLVNQLSLRDGWGSYAVNLIEHLSEQNIDCSVLSSVRNKKNDLRSIKDHRILPPLFVSRWLKLYFLIKNFYRIRKLILEADLVHVLTEPYSLIAYWTCRKRPILITLHGTYAIDHFRKWYLKCLYGRVYKYASRLICVSQFTKREVLKKIFLKNIIAIDNGVDYEKFQLNVSIDPSLENTNSIISTGALKFRKGYHVSIEAVGQVKKKYPNLKYYIIGSQKDKKYFNQLKDLVVKYSLQENVIFLENILEKDLIRFYYKSDLFLLTPIYTQDSKFEGFGLVYLEANACGKPVIGTYGCGAESAIKNRYNGLLVGQNNVSQTSRAIINILSDQDSAKAMGENGKKWAQKHDWSKVALKYIEVYSNIYKLI